MREAIYKVGRMHSSLNWVLDVLCGVQVGWIVRDEGNRRWYVVDQNHDRYVGPFRTLHEADAAVTKALSHEFGRGSPAN